MHKKSIKYIVSLILLGSNHSLALAMQSPPLKLPKLTNSTENQIGMTKDDSTLPKTPSSEPTHYCEPIYVPAYYAFTQSTEEAHAIITNYFDIKCKIYSITNPPRNYCALKLKTDYSICRIPNCNPNTLSQCMKVYEKDIISYLQAYGEIRDTAIVDTLSLFDLIIIDDCPENVYRQLLNFNEWRKLNQKTKKIQIYF